MSKISDESFEYTLLDDETRSLVWQRASEIKNLMRLTAENIINIGKKLTEVKEQLRHGSFQRWLRTEFEWSEQTARQFMQVYRWAETLENKNFVFSQLATSALYLLAAPSTPSAAREEVMSLVDAGEKVTYTDAKTIVNHYKKLTTTDEKQIEKIIDIEARSEEDNSSQIEFAFNRLYRLETANSGYLIRLYRADELETITNLNVGKTVKIKVGRRKGQTAKIVEILTDLQSTETDSEEVPMLPASHETQASNITVRTVNKSDLYEGRIQGETGKQLLLSYGKVCLAVEGKAKVLSAFIEQLQTNSAFVEETFERVQYWQQTPES
ncbi:DUF3102 domain-containing protein [Myxosarcina sp. GI1]|uniref:DUF3102 domain-containing protein n=1 Tax=Myxosarcina sp. GI1 TaxID=1541065 RepID=UPI00068C66DE|nr:DUF3102 domain-containing protein [Myxosarcina sp. GI1]